MTRVSVDGGSLPKHVVAAQLQLAAEEAVEKISRLEVFTSCDFKGKAMLTTGGDDVQLPGRWIPCCQAIPSK